MLVCRLFFQKLKINTKVLTKMENKKCKTEPIKIGTHSGNFHCDEILACYMLQHLPKYKNAEIIRTRDYTKLEDCDIVVDVGAVFSHENNKYDHHQESFRETIKSLRPDLDLDLNIRLSSAGLIYVHYGEEVLSSILKTVYDMELPSEPLRVIYKKIYQHFIMEIDAIDNGVEICDGVPHYKINTNLSARVERFNRPWNVESSGIDDEKIRFEKAKNLVGEELKERIEYYAKTWLPAREIVENAVKSASDVHESGEIIELSHSCPWKEHLFDLEKEHGIEGKIKYVLFLDSGTDWRVMGVPKQPGSYLGRKFLHKDWRGFRSSELQDLCKVKDAVFVHSTGFIGGALSREGAFQMAVKSLEGTFTN